METKKDAGVRISNIAGEPVGFVVAGYERGQLKADWDGKVHAELSAGRTSLGQCRDAGYSDWGLYALLPVEPATQDQEVPQ